MQNELFLINPTWKTEETLKIPKIQGRHSDLVTPSPRGLRTHYVKDNCRSSLLKKEVTPCFAPAVFILEKPQIGDW